MLSRAALNPVDPCLTPGSYGQVMQPPKVWGAHPMPLPFQISAPGLWNFLHPDMWCLTSLGL